MAKMVQLEAQLPGQPPFKFYAPADSTEEERQQIAFREYQSRMKAGQGEPTDAQKQGRQDLERLLEQAQARLKDTIPGSETYKRVVAEINNVRQELGLPPQEIEPPGMMQRAKETFEKAFTEPGSGLAGAGAGLATGLLEARGIGPASILEKGVKGAVQGAGVAPPVPPSAGPVAPTAPVVAPGPTGAPTGAPGGFPLRPAAGGSAVQNYAKAFGLTDIEAQRALDMTKQAGGVHDLTTQRRQALNLLAERFPTDRFVENPRFGGIMTPEPSVGSGPRAQYVSATPEPEVGPRAQPATSEGLRRLPAPKPIPTGPKPVGALEEVTQMLKRMAEGGSRVASGIGGAARALPVLSYPLAGYSIGSDVGAIQEELSKERRDYADMVLRASGALGTGLSLHPVTAPVGLPMALLSPLLAAGRRQMQETPEPTAEELERASRPAIGIYPPLAPRRNLAAPR